ncbi:MAG TPA: exodeoxyribonuclease VII large subunit [Ohtaekwangia sp.]|nr:exodeoxyribonuclease VII large subunit [Ohtaekwangia sp.]
MSATPYIKLSDLTRRIEQVISQAFGDQTYWIVAEISGHKFYPDKDRHYFDLVEKMENSSTETAKVKTKSWEQGSMKIARFEQETGEKFRDGLQVLINVKVSYHIIHGLSLTVRDIDHGFTLGNLERQRRETLKRLLTENHDFIQLSGDQYLTRNKQSRLNPVIQRIALIGSPKSEGYTDFVHTITSNQFDYTFSINNYYSTVQGTGAEHELVKTLVQVYNDHLDHPYDCVVITRGGGSRTDFLVFDTYALVRTAAKFPIPIITGIGHHKDISLLDLMVHTHTKTPTKAAEFIIAHNKSFEEKVLVFQRSIIIKTQQIMATRNKKIATLQHAVTQGLRGLLTRQKNSLMMNRHQIAAQARAMVTHQHHLLNGITFKFTSRPLMLLNNHQHILQNVRKDLKALCTYVLGTEKKQLHHFQSLITTMSPGNILRKGFAIVSQHDSIVTDPAQIENGSTITITLKDTDISATVNEKNDSHGKYDV